MRYSYDMKRLITSLFAISFLGAMFLSLSHMSFGMTMDTEMSGCIFMVEQEAICTMSAVDHIEVWQSLFTATVPLLILVLSLVVALLFTPNSIQPWLTAVKLRHLVYFYLCRLFARSQKNLLFSRDMHQRLFARGILHPQLYN